MVRKELVVGAVTLVFASGAWAQACPCAGGSRMNQTQLAAALVGKTVCAVLGSDRWQEYHSGSGTTGPLVELGNTAGGENVGTWSIIGTGAATQMSYAYSGGNTYAYAVCSEGSNVHFCGLRNITNATVLPGSASCGVAPAFGSRKPLPMPLR